MEFVYLMGCVVLTGASIADNMFDLDVQKLIKNLSTVYIYLLYSFMIRNAVIFYSEFVCINRFQHVLVP